MRHSPSGAQRRFRFLHVGQDHPAIFEVLLPVMRETDLRVVRFRSVTPKSCSSAASTRTIEGSETLRSAAAAVRLPLSTMRTKLLIARSLSNPITPFYGVVLYGKASLLKYLDELSWLFSGVDRMLPSVTEGRGGRDEKALEQHHLFVADSGGVLGQQALAQTTKPTEAEAKMFAASAGYEHFMGRWSRLLAPTYVTFAGVKNGDRVLDVGTGTGSLAVAVEASMPASEIVGVDPSGGVYRLRTEARHVCPRAF